MREVNGQQYQHATSKWTGITSGASRSFKSIAECKYEVKAPKELTNDAQGEVDGFVFKKKEHSPLSLKMKLREWFEFRAQLLAENEGRGVLQCQFDFAVSYGNGVNALKTDTLRSCMPNNDPRESNDSQDPTMVTIEFIYLRADFADGPAMVYEND